MPFASIPILINADKTALPLFKDISLSLEVPPNKTATFLNSDAIKSYLQ